MLLTTDKFCLLSADNYIAFTALVWSLHSLEYLHGRVLQWTTWAYLIGKFYTLVFVRLDPARDTREPVFELTLLYAEALL